MSDEKFNLSDVTFMIPVKIDSEDRIKNLNIVCMYLRTYFDCKIIIAEQGNNVPLIPDIIGQTLYDTYIFYKNKGVAFNKSRLINIMVKQSTTPLVAMHDSDVLAFVDQYIEAVNRLRKNIVDFVYPFNGHVINVPKSKIVHILETMRLENLQNRRPNRLKAKNLAPGGCVIYNRDKFIKAGMMNELFISYAPEDAEQLFRLTKLGYRMSRTSRPLFHMDHVKTVHSTENHEYVRSNLAEYHKILKMTTQQILNMVANWPWMKDK